MKYLKIFSLTLVILILVISGWQCSWMGESVGASDQIIVFADSVDWVFYKDALNSVFGKFYKTPAAEREYILKWVPFRLFDKYQNYKNIFILGRLNSKETVSQNVRQLLSPEIIEGVKSGKYFYVPKKHPWAVDQYVLFLIAKSRDDMIQKTHDLGDLMYRDFRKYYFTRLKKEMFARQEQKKLEKYLQDHYPFHLRIQHDFFIADENANLRYVWIRRVQPDRSILISWQPLPENFLLTPDWIMEERNRLAKQVYKGDVVVKDETRAYQVTFKQWNAIRLEGTWKNDQLMIGGPFRNISFVDENTHRIYSLDFYVQAIGKRKKPYIDQLDVIVHTFELNGANGPQPAS